MADTYEITNTAEVLDTRDVTNPVPSRRITFRSKATGELGTVTLPEDNLTPQVVHDAVAAKVATLDAIRAL